MSGKSIPIHPGWKGIRKDGSRVWVQTTASLISLGDRPASLGVYLDVTELKKAEEALKESGERYRTLVENVPVAVYRNTPGPKGKILMGNPGYYRMFGFDSEEEFKQFNVADFYMDPEERKAFSDNLLAQGSVSGVELALKKKDGTPFWGSVTAKVLYDERGEVTCFDCTIMDITARKQAEEALKESEARYRALFEGAAEGVLVADIETKEFIYANPAICRMLGYSEEELRQMAVSDIHPKEDLEHVISEFEAQAREEKTLAQDIPCLRKDGEIIYADITTSKVFIDGRQCSVGFFTDITKEKKLEAQLAQAQKVEAIGTLAGGMAHNFNNLLMSIQGNASLMLLETDPSHPNYERVKNIEKSVQNGSKLTSQLLGYAREGRYEIRPISLNQMVEETSYTFGQTKKEIRVHRELAKDLFGIKADQGQIEQVLLNLYVNAADAMPVGGDLLLKTMNVTDKDITGKPYEAKPGNYVLLSVTDTGVGMDKKTMDRIFDPFFTTKGMGRGTGLGLASVYGIVKAHAGYIDVESKKGHGTTFSIYLPASSEREVIEEKVLPEKILKGKETILLVDDEDIVIDVGEEMLKSLGYKVLIARGGKEAIKLYKEGKGKIDMVLLDMIMPDMGGGETYDRMKEINSDIKVLLLSGYSIDGQATEILRRGCDGFIQKPFNMKQLSRSIREILDKK